MWSKMYHKGNIVPSMVTPQPTSIWLPKQSTKKRPQIRTGLSPPLPTPFWECAPRFFWRNASHESYQFDHISSNAYVWEYNLLHVMCPLRRSQRGVFLGSDLVSAAQYQNGETSNKDKQQTLETPRVGVEVLCSWGLDPMLQSRPKRQQSAKRSAAILAHCSPPCEGFRSVGREHGKSSPMGSLGTMGR